MWTDMSQGQVYLEWRHQFIEQRIKNVEKIICKKECFTRGDEAWGTIVGENLGCCEKNYHSIVHKSWHNIRHRVCIKVSLNPHYKLHMDLNYIYNHLIKHTQHTWTPWWSHIFHSCKCKVSSCAWDDWLAGKKKPHQSSSLEPPVSGHKDHMGEGEKEDRSFDVPQLPLRQWKSYMRTPSE